MLVKVAKAGPVELQLGGSPQLGKIDQRDRIEKMLLDCQIEFDVKDRIWNAVVDEEVGLNVRVRKLLGTADEELVGPVVELVLADGRS